MQIVVAYDGAGTLTMLTPGWPRNTAVLPVANDVSSGGHAPSRVYMLCSESHANRSTASGSTTISAPALPPRPTTHWISWMGVGGDGDGDGGDGDGGDGDSDGGDGDSDGGGGDASSGAAHSCEQIAKTPDDPP